MPESIALELVSGSTTCNITRMSRCQHLHMAQAIQEYLQAQICKVYSDARFRELKDAASIVLKCPGASSLNEFSGRRQLTNSSQFWASFSCLRIKKKALWFCQKKKKRKEKEPLIYITSYRIKIELLLWPLLAHNFETKTASKLRRVVIDKTNWSADVI